MTHQEFGRLSQIGKNKYMSDVMLKAEYDKSGNCTNIRYCSNACYGASSGVAAMPDWNWSATFYSIIEEPTSAEKLAKFVKDNNLKVGDIMINKNTGSKLRILEFCDKFCIESNIFIIFQSIMLDHFC